MEVNDSHQVSTENKDVVKDGYQTNKAVKSTHTLSLFGYIHVQHKLQCAKVARAYPKRAAL